jgi:hypothetical protein
MVAPKESQEEVIGCEKQHKPSGLLLKSLQKKIHLTHILHP